MRQRIEPDLPDFVKICANQTRPAELGGAGVPLLRKWAALRKKIVSIPEREVLVTTRGFQVHDAEMARRLENVGRAFLAGYHAAAGAVSLIELQASLENYDPSHRGFAYEGASMGLAIADFMTPFSNLWRDFSQGIGSPHIYMVYVGYGWALARLPVAVLPAVKRLNEPLRWLAMDGYGFHQGYFHRPRHSRQAAPPAKFSGYAARAFDQGLGRSLWFVHGGGPDTIAEAIGLSPTSRAADLWAGVGLAAAYAGGASRSALERLRSQAGRHLPHVAQGAAFAAEARRRAGNPVGHSNVACQVLCGVAQEEAAAIARESYPTDPQSGRSNETYEIWRRQIRNHFGAVD